MTTLRTTTLALLLGLAGLPAFAFDMTFDLPRLDFPPMADATQATTASTEIVVKATK
ncbi:MAG: hypothetical protein WAT77_05180 [Paracoccaceae bacterium]